jgi:minor extracellular serine protease Vpr
MRLPKSGSVVAVVAIGATAVLLAAAGGHGSRPSLQRSDQAAGWRGLVGGLRRQIPLGQRMLVLLNAPSLADKVAAAGGVATDDQERRWSAAAAATQQQLLFELIAKGARMDPDYRYTRVLNGFSAALDAGAVALLERAPQVRGVFPVRAAYPASTSRTLLQNEADQLGTRLAAPVAVGGFDGRGVTVALLDTGVDRTAPYLHGHVLEGVDIVGSASDAQPQRNPGYGSALELHGTETAGIVVGAGGPARLSGVASGATVFPIRVAGWQPDGRGSFAVYSRTDQILAGLERAVDPNLDGDAHDAARIVLVPLVEPFAAFPDTPLARAVRGALRLDTLVVTAAGNDGPAGPVFGSVGGPGGAAEALTVGAADLRRRVGDVPVVVRAGLDVLLRRRTTLAGGPAPGRPLQLGLVRLGERPGRSFLDQQGNSVVAGKAALISGGSAPRARAAAAIGAGAAVVLLAENDLPAGGLGLDQRLAAPVIAVPPALEDETEAAAARGAAVTISIGSAHPHGNEAFQRVAGFSSSGLAYGGHVKPDVIAPGVGLPTVQPGADPDGTSHFVTVSGTSAAAAAAAGVAALVLQVRPSLSAAELRGVLVGSARRLAAQPTTAQGAGLLDPGSAAAAQMATVPASISFGRGAVDGPATRDLVIRNLSGRPLTVYVGAARRSKVTVAVRPRTLRLSGGASARVRVRVSVAGAVAPQAVTGTLSVVPLGGAALRVPWSVVLDDGPQRLLGPLVLSRSSFESSDPAPSVLSLRIGRVERHSGLSAVEPVARLDVQLQDASGKLLGLLTRVRDALPGRYVFSLTGHDPNGRRLAPGVYRLRLVAWPAAGGRASVRSIEFRIQ